MMKKEPSQFIFLVYRLEREERNSLKNNNKRESCRLSYFSVKQLVVLGVNEFYMMNGFDCVCFEPLSYLKKQIMFGLKIFHSADFFLLGCFWELRGYQVTVEGGFYCFFKKKNWLKFIFNPKKPYASIFQQLQ